MPGEETVSGVKISSFPTASNIQSADLITGLQDGENKNFSFSRILSWLQQQLTSLFVPNSKIGVSNGVAELDSSGTVPSSQLPPIASTAADVTYDNTGSGLSASDVQEAIDELAAGAGGSTAATTSYDNTGSGLSATNAQDALDELSDEKADQITVAPVEASTTASAAHGLGSIFYLGGKLYRALADIAAGGTINTAAGGNATETSIAQNFKRTVTLTSAQYAQLSAAEKAADILYIITDEPAPSAYTSNPEMDGTASPGSSGAWAKGDHVHPSDTTKANQTDLTSIRATGTTNNTGAAIAAGVYFYLNNVLCFAKSQISANDTFTLNTNYEIVPGGGLNETISGVDISSYITPATGVNISRAYRVGRLVYICGSVPKFTAANTVVRVGTMTKCKPFTSSAIGNLAQATASDFGYGIIQITTTGAMDAIYSKTTSYGVYFSVCYYTVDL